VAFRSGVSSILFKVSADKGVGMQCGNRGTLHSKATRGF